ncbi:Mitochondrial fission protein, partial [Elasticomyces elasticus]
MTSRRGRSTSPPPRHGRPRHNAPPEEESVLSSRQLEAFGRTVHATASQLIGPLGEGAVTHHYQNALGELHRELRRPMIQRSVFSLARTNPRELVRSKLSTSEIQHRALTYLPDELLRNIPDTKSPYSLFQGFQASAPEEEEIKSKGRHGRHGSRNQRMLEEAGEPSAGEPAVVQLRNKKNRLDHRLEMMGVRKTMCSSEIREIDNKIANLNTLRKLVLERLAGLESEEADLEHEIAEVHNKLENLQEELDDAAALAQKSPSFGARQETDDALDEEKDMDTGFMSESIYEKIPSPRAKKHRNPRRKSMPVLHEHLEPGSRIREIQAHNDTITALDFDVPFGTMVTAALDDTVRVWDLNAGRCIGLLEGHLSSVRCLQVEDNIVATGSMDASVRLWDLSQADYAPLETNRSNTISSSGRGTLEEDELFEAEATPQDLPPPPPGSMADTPLFTLSAHVAEVTALHFRNSTLVSGS